MSDLKPCPFCGGEARIHASHHGDTHYYQVECGNEYDCGAWPAVRVCHTKAEAVEAWNTRHHFGLTDEDYNVLLDEMGVSERTCYSERSDGWECSECGFLDAYVTADFINYCPNCGAKVVSE